MSRTDPNYKVRVRSYSDGIWVLRDELDDDGSVIGVQCLKSNGFWSEQRPEGTGLEEPTIPTIHLEAAGELPEPTFGTAYTDADGRVWTSTGDGEWSTSGGPSGTIISSSPPPAGGSPDAMLTPDGLAEAVKAIEKGRKEYGTMVVNPAMQKLLDEWGAKEEREFLHGKSFPYYADVRPTPR